MENGLNPDAPEGEKVSVGSECAGFPFVADGAVGAPEDVDHLAVPEDVVAGRGEVVRAVVRRNRTHVRCGTLLFAGRQQRLCRAEQHIFVRQVVGREPLRRRLRDSGLPVCVRVGAHISRDTAEKQRPQHGEYADQMSHRRFCLTRQKYNFSGNNYRGRARTLRPSHRRGDKHPPGTGSVFVNVAFL